MHATHTAPGRVRRASCTVDLVALRSPTPHTFRCAGLLALLTAPNLSLGAGVREMTHGTCSRGAASIVVGTGLAFAMLFMPVDAAGATSAMASPVAIDCSISPADASASGSNMKYTQEQADIFIDEAVKSALQAHAEQERVTTMFQIGSVFAYALLVIWMIADVFQREFSRTR